jgi:serine/threonine protein kinase
VVGQKIGQGEFATVFTVQGHPNNVIKVSKSLDKVSVHNHIAEAKALRKLHRLVDEDPRKLILVQSKVPGVPLETYYSEITSQAELTHLYNMVIDKARWYLDTFQLAHDDLHPGNIMIHKDMGPDGTPKLTVDFVDFGQSHQVKGLGGTLQAMEEIERRIGPNFTMEGREAILKRLARKGAARD